VRHIDDGPVRLLAEQFLAPVLRADLVHFFDLIGPVLAPCRRFTATSCDAKVVDQPEAFTPLQRAYKRRVIPWTVRRAQLLVAISQAVKEQTVRAFGADPTKIHVVLPGPGFPSRDDDPGPPPVEPPFLLSVGNLSTTKNLPFLIRAFDDAAVPARLVLAGRPAVGYDAILAAARSARSRDRIIVLDSVSDREVDALYRAATALLIPSRYEGFGFTPLEAMRRGCPVVASDIPALREITGRGGLLVPLDDGGAWTDALRRLVHERPLRDELRARGRANVAAFSWDEAARQTLALISEAASAAR
jgi:glycosyltransferase involved in cell wall biosynthesis